VDLSILTNFFMNQGLLQYVNHVLYSVGFIARVIYTILKQLGFRPADVLNALGKAGERLKASAIKMLCEHAERGVEQLENLIKKKLEDLNINEVAAELLASRTKEIGKSMDESGLDKEGRRKAAKHIQKGMEQIGGATKEIAAPLAQALVTPDRREALAAAMQQKLDSWFSLSMEARGESMIKNSRQIITGTAGGLKVDLKMRTSGKGKIVGSTQRVNLTPRKPRR
jgi:hypothetical protein